MTMPQKITPDDLRQTAVSVKGFPKTREEAEAIAERIENQAKLLGCACRNLKIQFVEPPHEAPFVHVEHDRLCRLAQLP